MITTSPISCYNIGKLEMIVTVTFEGENFGHESVGNEHFMEKALVELVV